VHSYAPMVEDEADIAATIRVNGRDIPVAIQRDNVIGVQFHPEKSGAAGLALLQRFVSA
jgi:glutamine amidotransferase